VAVIVEIVEVERITRERSAAILVGPPERGRADWMVEKLAELGVATLQPIDTERAHWTPAEVRLDRWHRVARAALRQSRRCHELEVREPVALSAALALPHGGTAHYLADPEGTSASRLSPHPLGMTVGLVGPAVGFSISERSQMTSAGYVGISLSDGRLRTETAALALASWWSAGG
jgi:16S rRNA (uracil1498-N3)-methyltransferase